MLFAACLTAVVLSAAGMNVAETGGAIKLVFSDTGTDSDASTKLTAIKDILASGSDYVTLTTATEVYKGRAGRGNKLGAGSKAYKLVMALKTPVKPTSIVINAMPFQSDDDKANNKMVFMGDTIVLTEVGAFADYTITYDGNTEVSEIALEAVQANKNRIYVTSITINAGESAAPELKTVATVEKLWSGDVLGWTTADSRQWTGYGEYVYWESKANHAIVGTKDGLKVDTIIKNDLIDGTAFSVDGAGNFVVEGTFPSTASHIFLVKHDASAFVDIPVTGLGRTDIATATGDVFSAEGGVVFLYGNSVNLLAVAIKNAGAEGQEVKVKEIAIAGSSLQNFVVAGDTLVQYVQRRSVGQTGFDVYENGVNKGPIEGMTGYKGTTLGGAMVTLAGKVFAVYPAGATNYSSEFSVLNIDDKTLAVDKADASKTLFYANTTTKFNGTDVGVYVNATKIDENNAYIQVGNGADGTALFKLSVSVAAELVVSYDETQGTVTGGGDIAVGANATVVATPNPGYEFVAWKKGETTVSTDPTYTFAVNENTALTAVFEAKANVTITLAVNDATLGSITLPEGIVMGENSVVYGTPVALVAVPAEGSTFAGWFKGEVLYSSESTLNLTGKESISLLAKFITSNTLIYELNGGITNDYGWTSKKDMFNDFMADAGVTDHPSYDEYYAMTDRLGSPGVCAKLTNVDPAFAMTEKWGWLKQYIVDVTAAQLATSPTPTPTALAVTDANSAAWRYAVGAFFMDTQRASWPVSADFSVAGSYEAYKSAWKHAYANPTTVDAEFVLNEPYKDGWTFMGWFTEPDGKGTKVTSINIDTQGTLYAYFVPYINTVAEFIAMEDGTKAQQVRGTVTFVQGANFWIQDATGGILCYGKNNGLTEGDAVILQGDKTTYNGSPEVNNATVVSKEAGNELAPQIIALSAAPAFLNKLVYIEGLKMAEYQPVMKNDTTVNYYNPVVTDGVDSIILYNMGVVEKEVPVGTKVNIKAVVGIFKTTYQLRGKKEWVLASSAAGKDDYNYPVRLAEGDFEGYKLQNEWIFANKFDNYSDNVPGPTDMVRGMAVKDGIMYFVNRSTSSLVRVDGKTGIMLDPLPVTGEHVFQAEKTDSLGKPTGEWAASVTLAFNDIKIDAAGNLLVGGCSTNSQYVQIYKVDEKTGVATPVINERLWDNVEDGLDQIAWRMDAFGVYGDVDNDAVVMVANSWGLNAFRWTITGGVAGKAEVVPYEPDEAVACPFIKNNEGAIEWTLVADSDHPQAAQIFPLEGNMFYVDLFGAMPMLFDSEGYILDDLHNNPSGTMIGNNEGDSCKLGYGPNGICEFQVGEDYFLAIVASNTDGVPNTAFALYKYKDAAKSFAEMEPLWFFPNKGMGGSSNPGRACVPYVEVDGNVATIYLYAVNNGYGVYTFTGKTGTGIENIIDASYDKVQKVLENGVIYIYRNGVKYNTMGAQVK